MRAGEPSISHGEQLRGQLRFRIGQPSIRYRLRSAWPVLDGRLTTYRHAYSPSPLTTPSSNRSGSCWAASSQRVGLTWANDKTLIRQSQTLLPTTVTT